LKKRITGILLVLILAVTLFPVQIAASDPIATLRFTNNPKENITFILGNRHLTVANLPNTTAFKSIWVSVINESGDTVVEDLLSRRSDSTASMSLSSLSNGYYYVELYFSAGGNRYNSYVYGKEVKFHWSDGSGVFIASPAMEHNTKTYQSGRNDNAALAFYLTPTNYIQSENASIVELANEITSGIADEYGKTLAIHDWVCTNLWYDWDMVSSGKNTAQDAVSTLSSRRAVCEGYANLTSALLQASGIPVKNVYGYGRLDAATDEWTQQQLSGTESNHVWNEAFVGGRWIMIDTTWNCGNEYQDGKKTESDGIHSYRYFDSTLEAFSLDHYIDPYPETLIPQADDPSAWAAGQVNIAISSGLVPLKLRVKYISAITRAEFCALAVSLYENAMGTEITGRVKFVDTANVDVEKMAYLGVVNGVGDNSFAPNQPLNREQAAVILSRLAAALGETLPVGAATFRDKGSLSFWAVEAVGQMQLAGIMKGVGDDMFSPRGRYTREQSIVTTLRMFDIVNLSAAA